MSVGTPEQRRVYNQRYYEKTKDVHNPSRYARRRAESASNRQWIQDYKSTHPCVDCGRMFPYYVMDFDHTATDKTMNVSQMMSYSLSRIQEEVAKCLLRCANCHRERTHQRAGNSAAE